MGSKSKLFSGETSSIMPTYASRLYAGPADLEALTHLISTRPPARRDDFPALADLQEMMGVADVCAHTRVWEDAAGHVAGMTILETDEDGARLIFEVSPEAAAEGLGAQMLIWAVDCLRRAAPEEPVAQVSISCAEDDAMRRALLQEHGFSCQPEHTLRLARSLAEPIPDAQFPVGFSLRHGVGADEAEAWVALHRAAFGTEHMTVEYRRAMIDAPSYDPELDLVAVAPDGTFAAYCAASISDEENEISGRRDGFTDPVATHPAYQRRGLSRALLLTALRLLRERGMDTARLGTSSENVAMQRAARAVGYRVKGRTFFFTLFLGHVAAFRKV